MKHAQLTNTPDHISLYHDHWQLLSGIQKIPPKVHGDIISKSKYERKLTYIGKIR